MFFIAYKKEWGKAFRESFSPHFSLIPVVKDSRGLLFASRQLSDLNRLHFDADADLRLERLADDPFHDLLDLEDRPTAVVASDDILAVALERICVQRGLSVPEDLSIVSFNNSLFARLTSPQLTSIDINSLQLGIEAASQLINHIENPNLLATKIIVPHSLIVRKSCRKLVE